MNPRPTVAFSPYAVYSREEWARLRADTPMTLNEGELENLGGLTERVSTQEVVDIYLPLSRLLNFYIEVIPKEIFVFAAFATVRSEIVVIVGNRIILVVGCTHRIL